MLRRVNSETFRWLLLAAGDIPALPQYHFKPRLLWTREFVASQLHMAAMIGLFVFSINYW